MLCRPLLPIHSFCALPLSAAPFFVLGPSSLDVHPALSPGSLQPLLTHPSTTLAVHSLVIHVLISNHFFQLLCYFFPLSPPYSSPFSPRWSFCRAVYTISCQ